MAEMLRLRREVVLGSMPSGYLLEPSLNHLRSTPITADTLFGGQISAALATDREDQLHTSLALGNNTWQRQGTFKRPPPKSPARVTPSKKKKSSPAQKSIFPPPAPEKQTSFPRAKGRGKGNKPFTPKNKPSAGRGGLSRGTPFYRLFPTLWWVPCFSTSQKHGNQSPRTRGFSSQSQRDSHSSSLGDLHSHASQEN